VFQKALLEGRRLCITAQFQQLLVISNDPLLRLISNFIADTMGSARSFRHVSYWHIASFVAVGKSSAIGGKEDEQIRDIRVDVAFDVLNVVSHTLRCLSPHGLALCTRVEAQIFSSFEPILRSPVVDNGG
jgi:hypothetical protein